VRQKLARVLEAQSTAPWVPVPGVRLTVGLKAATTGETTSRAVPPAIFPPVRRRAQRHQGLTGNGPRICFEARKHREGRPDLVARFGGIPLTRDRRAVIRDPAPVPATVPRKELISRLRRRQCELCEHGTTVAVHQVAGLASLGKPGPEQPPWAVLMAKMRRKTLIVCAACHDYIHATPVASTA